MNAVAYDPVVALTDEAEEVLCQRAASADTKQQRAMLRQWLAEQGKAVAGSESEARACRLIQRTGKLIEARHQRERRHGSQRRPVRSRLPYKDEREPGEEG